MTTGGRIKLQREIMRMTQKDLADKIGMNTSVYNRIELDTRPVRSEELAKIAEVLGVSTDYLSLKTNIPTMSLSIAQRKLIDRIDLSDDELLSFPITIGNRELTNDEKKKAFKVIRTLLEEDQ